MASLFLCPDAEEGGTGGLLIKEEGPEEDRDPLRGMNPGEERTEDSGSEGEDVDQAPNHPAEPRPVWPAILEEEEPKSRAVAGGLLGHADCLMFEGPGLSRPFFSRGAGDGGGSGAGAGGAACLYGMGTGSLAPPADDPGASLASLGPLDWRADPTLLGSKPAPQLPLLAGGEIAPGGADGFDQSAFGGGGFGPGGGTGDGSSAGVRGRGGGREKRFFCSFCGKGFSFPKQVEIHQRVHTGEKPFGCTQCRQRFSHSGNLKRHQRVHTGEKPFSCTLCEKRFSHLHQLKMHQRIHTGERPFGCAHCGKRFSERSYLRIHQQRSHSGVYNVR